MKVERLKNLLSEFGENVKFNYELKKKHGLTLEEKLRFFIKQTI
tara:strand:+ start:604 stop:735 length:132 start_codon:yes stop_codon:yes gene_type:complete